jgi:putative transposase
VLACYRYIELNPLRAAMVGHPGGYLWSSHAVNSGMRTDPFVSPHAEFLGLSADDENRRSNYRVLLEEEIDAPLLQAIREATNGGYPLAGEAFKASVIEPLGWKIAPGKPGPRRKQNSGSDPELRFAP